MPRARNFAYDPPPPVDPDPIDFTFPSGAVRGGCAGRGSGLVVEVGAGCCRACRQPLSYYARLSGEVLVPPECERCGFLRALAEEPHAPLPLPDPGLAAAAAL